MPKKFNLKIYATDKVVFDGECESLVLPATDGEYAILANHEDLLVALVLGETRFAVDGETKVFFTGLGFAYVENNSVVVFVDTAERPEEIDLRRAEEAKERAEEKLRQETSRQEYYHTQASLARAMSRMKEAARHRRGF